MGIASPARGGTRRRGRLRARGAGMAALAVPAACAAVLVACAGSPTSPARSSTAPPSGAPTTTAAAVLPSTAGGGVAAQLQREFISVVDRVRPSVVEISTESGLGSGVVFDAKGDIVTNAHVVSGASAFEVTLSDGRSRPGVLVGAYVPDDLAVVRISGADLPPPATFADSAAVEVGEIVLAVGNPLGLSSSVTDGIVSFNGRTVSEGNGVVLPATIQTSAPINPGNSGGALVDLSGAVIGIPTLAASDAQDGGTAPGIGFAIPSNTVKLIAGQLAESGTVTDTGRAALGIRGTTAMDGTGSPGGVIVVEVSPGSAAERAGARAGDVITAIDGKPVPTLATLLDLLAGLRVGQTVVLTVNRDGQPRTLSVTLQAQSTAAVTGR